jgi:hypothetical protein
MIAAGSGLAIYLSLAIRNGFSWWPEDAWRKVPVAALIVSCVAIIADLLRAKHLPNSATASAEALSRRNSPSVPAYFRLISIAIAVASAAWLIFPRGDAWSELQSQQGMWCVVITLAASLAWWGIAGCRSPVATTVGLATIPLLIASALLTSLSIMKVTEPLIAVATVLGLCSLLDLRRNDRALPIAIAPTVFAMSGFIAHANFQSYLNLPRTLYFLAMLSPAIIALAARMAQRKTTRFAIGITVMLSLLLAGAIGSWAYIAGEVSSFIPGTTMSSVGK